jgi:hypothetical protein
LLQLLELLLLCLLCIGGRDGIAAEGQDAAQLSGHAANRVADAGIAEQAANCTTEWLAGLAQNIAEPSLRTELALLCLLLGQLGVLQLLQLLLDLLLLCLLCIGGGNRIRAEWQDRSANATGQLADLSASADIAK